MKTATQTAYSYVRFSSKPQEQGDSERRQLDAARRYAKKRGVTLDESLKDLGVSAYRGSNKRAALGRFMEMVGTGDIQTGSILIVESLDRLSRQEPLAAFDTFRAIIGAGIEVVSLTPEMEFTTRSINQNPWMLGVVLSFMQRAHEESKTKSERVSAAWQEKQKTAKAGVAITRRTPGWLTVDDAGKFQVIPQAKATVLNMVRMAIQDGMGCFSIARKLNTDKVPTLSTKGVKTWDFGTVQNILRSRRLVGEYQPHRFTTKGSVADGNPIPNFYPAILKEAEFLALQDALNSRRKVRGRGANTASNIFGPVLYSSDGSRLVVGFNSKKSKFLQSVNGQKGLTKLVTLPLVPFEECFFDWVKEVTLRKPVAVGDKANTLAAELAVLEMKKNKLQKAIDDDTTGDIDFLVSQLAKTNQQSNAKRRDLETARAEAARKEVGTKDIAALVGDKTPDGRVKVRAAIQNAIARITVAVGLADETTNRAAAVWVEFRNGETRLFFIHLKRHSTGHHAASISDDGKWKTNIPMKPEYLDALAKRVANCKTAEEARAALHPSGRSGNRGFAVYGRGRNNH